MSTHEVLVVKIEEIIKHDNADSLEIIKVSGYDYSIIAKKGDFKVNDLAIFIEPDYVVPIERSEFSFLKKGRVTACRLRGIWSEGLLIKAQHHHNLGDNVIEEYGIKRWEPPALKGNDFHWGAEGSKLQGGYCAKGPDIVAPKYDLENYKKYSKLITENDFVYKTVKIHGTNARFVYHNKQMFCGSRTTWKAKPGEIREYKNGEGQIIQKETPKNTWWDALEQNSWIEEFCKANPDVVLYGEIFGSVIQGNKFHYGYKDGKLGVRIFDVLENNKWVSFHELYTNLPKYSNLQLVPTVYYGNFNKQLLEELAEEVENCFENCGDNHIREGIVIKLRDERFDPKIGRVALKYVGRNYLGKS